MAWYTINYVCGHIDREQLYGKNSERQNRIAWAERNKMCPACYQAEIDRKRLADTKAATEANAGLPALSGSVSQIAWAETIRAKAAGCIALAVGEYCSIERIVPTCEDVTAFAARILKQNEAKYWIDRRADLGSSRNALAYICKRLREIALKAEGIKALGLR